MYHYKIGLSAQEHDDFIKNHPQANLLQSSDWAKIKNDWGNERIGFYNDKQELIASVSLLIQSLPLGFSLIYTPRGPIMDYDNKALVQFVFDTLKQYGKSKKALFIKLDPLILLAISDKNETLEKATGQTAIQNIIEAGADWTGRTTDIAQNIQPRFQAMVYAKDFSEEKLAKKIRQNIRTARNKGVTITVGGKELIHDFAVLMKKTENRKQIDLRGQDYYEKLLKTYGNDAYITMTRLNLRERLHLSQKELDKALALQDTFTKETKQNKITATANAIKRHQNDIAFVHERLKEGQDDVPLAATLSLHFGKTSENLYAGMDDKYRSYNAPLLTWFETANQAFQRGALSQNLGGIENTLDGGLYHFKAKLNPTIEEYIGEFNLAINPFLYRLANAVYTLRKTIRSRR